jgi:foldase protein PrsA
MDEQTTNAAPAGGKNKAVLYGTIVVILAIAVGAGYLFATGKLGSTNDMAGDETAQGAVARVNDEEISRKTYDTAVAQMKAAAQQQGVTLTDDQLKEQVITSLVNNRLLVQAATKEGVTVTDDQINTEHDQIVTNAGGEDAFNTQLTSLGVTDDQIRNELREQLLVNAYLLTKVSASSTAPATDDEVNAFYADLKANNETVPELADVRSQIEQQITFQKQQQAVASLIDSLRAQANIEVLI